MAEDDEQFWNKIIMSDEAHFTLNGTVNKQNCRIYATENPQEIQEVPLHEEKVNKLFPARLMAKSGDLDWPKI